MNRFLSLIFLVPVIFAVSCGEKYEIKDVAETDYAVVNSAGTVCILTYGSEFKLKLISELVPALNSMSYSVKVDSISNSAAYSPKDFSVLILLSSIEKFSPLPLAADYMKANDYSPKLVYVSTYSLFAAPYGTILDSSKIDAVTSASKLDENVVTDAKNAILVKVNKVISKPQ